MPNYYTRGEFARNNGVSPFTLRLYDKIGILKPAFTDQQNGYHYYSVLQSQQLMSINLCTKAGFSLKEIRLFQEQGMTDQKLQEVLCNLESNLEHTIKALSANLNMVRSIRYYADAWQTYGLNNPFIENHISFHGFLAERKPFSDYEYAQDYNAFLKKVETVMGYPAEYPYSFLLWEIDSEIEIQMLVRTVDNWEGKNFYQSPEEQTFLIVAFEGNFSIIPEKIQQLKAYAVGNGLEIGDYAILTPVQRHLFVSQGEAIIFVLGIPVNIEIS